MWLGRPEFVEPDVAVREVEPDAIGKVLHEAGDDEPAVGGHVRHGRGVAIRLPHQRPRLERGQVESLDGVVVDEDRRVTGGGRHERVAVAAHLGGIPVGQLRHRACLEVDAAEVRAVAAVREDHEFAAAVVPRGVGEVGVVAVGPVVGELPDRGAGHGVLANHEFRRPAVADAAGFGSVPWGCQCPAGAGGGQTEGGANGSEESAARGMHRGSSPRGGDVSLGF